ATGTGAVAIELARAEPSRTVVGVDQSDEMLAAGRERVRRAGLDRRISLEPARAETLPFEDGEFDSLTFTYLLRYVDDPPATLAELARVVRPGRLVSPGWHEVGRFLGPSIRDFYGRAPLPAQLEWWHAAGLRDVVARRLSLGGGVVVWATRG